MSDPRIAQAEGVLASHGVWAGLSVAGHTDDILAVRAPITRLNQLRALSAELKTLGFRYIALEFEAE